MLIFLRKNLFKLLLTAVVLTAAILAGATDVFSADVHRLMGKLFHAFAVSLLPHAIDFLMAALIGIMALWLYQPIRDGLSKALGSTHTNVEGRQVLLKVVPFIYWGGAVVVSLSLIAPDLLGRVFLGSTLFLAAITLALQGIIGNFVSGILLVLMPKFKLGDEIAIIGLDVKGTILEKRFLFTLVKAADGVINVSNSDIWGKPVKVIDPPKSKIEVPTDF